MGQHVTATLFTASDQARYRTRIHRCLEAFGRMVSEGRFAAEEPSTGVEIELALVDDEMRPAMLNHAVLDRSASDVLTSELGRWNLEINLPPRMLPGAGAGDLEQDVLDAVSSAGDCARGVGARAVTIGILPTLAAEHLASDQLTEDPRYALLNRQMLTARGEPFRLDITEPPAPRHGPVGGAPAEHLVLDVDSIAPEAACTSLQLHLQLTPDAFPAYWNAAQAIAGLQVALAANSPFLLGRRLWAETRVPLFTQAVDTRPVELRNQGVRPRVWFGDRWAHSAYDLFEENVRYCCPWPRTRTPSPSWTRAARRACTSCGCTTARCGAGTARCTTSPTPSRTCGWRTACCPPARRPSTPWPTRCSSTASSAPSPSPSARPGS
jgi:hypothetical protein